MPNSRRRRFSVHNGIGGKGPCKTQNNSQSRSTEPDTEINSMAHINSLVSKTRNNKIQASSSRNNRLEIIADCCESSTSLSTVRKLSTGVVAVDKDTTASSSNIDLFNILQTTEVVPEPTVKSIEKGEGPKRTRPLTRDTTPLHRDKYPRQHRIKVRSPKRRMPMPDVPATKNFDILKSTVATSPIDWDQEMEICVDTTPANVEPIEDERQSEHSLDDMCRICHGGDVLSLELGQLISACSCRGTVGRVHVKCLERWLTESGKSRCELCGTRYATRRVHRYGVPRALVMWILSQNAKQLMVDSLGIMLMSPLAVLAAWLSGRTLAGLMTQDSHSAPWPLASTFVLACMTLVCYYCWIVSAATRHALGWWVWYRSQYEVRLTMLNDD